MSKEEKHAAFEAYDFDSDTKWRDYFGNLTIPPERSDDQALVRRYKQKFYKLHIDPDFEVQPLPARPSSSSSAQTSQQPSSSRSAQGNTNDPSSAPSSSANRQQQQPRVFRAPPAASQSPASFLGADLRLTVAVLHGLVAVFSVLALIPIMPRSLLLRAYRVAFTAGLAVTLLSIYRQFGLPRALSIQAAKDWLQLSFSSPGFAILLQCLIFLPSSPPVPFALASPASVSVQFLSTYLSENFSRAPIYQQYLARPCAWLVQNRQQVEILAASADIWVGFLLILNLLGPQRNLLQIVFFWQLLKIKFHLPATSWYHRQVWSQWGQRVEPLLQQYFPVALHLIGYAKGWFNAVG